MVEHQVQLLGREFHWKHGHKIQAGRYLMAPELITALAGGITAVAGALAWGIRKMFISMSDYLKELKPNGGSSIKDQVNRLEKRVDDIYTMLADK